MTSIYIIICGIFFQELVQGFLHNNIGIFILTFLYTMFQNVVFSKGLLMTINESI